jgi:hypothetical protein
LLAAFSGAAALTGPPLIEGVENNGRSQKITHRVESLPPFQTMIFDQPVVDRAVPVIRVLCLFSGMRMARGGALLLQKSLLVNKCSKALHNRIYLTQVADQWSMPIFGESWKRLTG